MLKGVVESVESIYNIQKMIQILPISLFLETKIKFIEFLPENHCLSEVVHYLDKS